MPQSMGFGNTATNLEETLHVGYGKHEKLICQKESRLLYPQQLFDYSKLFS
jgi:hypothetical protein